jgi:hypothetical protein
MKRPVTQQTQSTGVSGNIATDLTCSFGAKVYTQEEADEELDWNM